MGHKITLECEVSCPWVRDNWGQEAGYVSEIKDLLLNLARDCRDLFFVFVFFKEVFYFKWGSALYLLHVLQLQSLHLEHTVYAVFIS